MASAPYSQYGTIKKGRRTFAQTRLKTPLQANKTYVVEFSTLRRWRSFYSNGDMGAYLTTDTFKQYDYISQNIQPQVVAPQDSIYHDEHNYQEWVRVMDTFTAQGGEQFLTLGNFNNYGNPSYPRMEYQWPLEADSSLFRYNHVFHGEYFFDAVYVYDANDTLYTVQLPPDTTLCPGDSLRLHAWHSNSFALGGTRRFRWSTGATDSSISVSQPGTYWVEVSYDNRWRQRDSMVVDFYPPYPGAGGSDTTLCAGDSLWVNPPPGATRQYWADQPNAPAARWLPTPGTYFLHSYSACDTLVDTFQLAEVPRLDSLELPKDTLICRGDTLVIALDSLPGVSYRWSTGATGPRLVLSEGGWIELELRNRCEVINQRFRVEREFCSDPPLYFPNSFTPNGDGLNDAFTIVNLPEENRLEVYDRWGSRQYQAAPYRNDWEGTGADGRALTGGVYVWMLQYFHNGEWRTARGTVNLLR